MKKPEPEEEFKFSTGVKFADMTATQKWIFVGKIAVCIVTFGYAFPHAQFE